MVDQGGTKQNFHSFLLLFFYLSLVTSLPLLHNFLQPKQGEGEMKVDSIAAGISPKNMESNHIAEDNNLGMEIEECDNEGQECLNRGIAHLDYIYTQQHSP